jgi:predicted nucleic acid-binding protein
MNGPLVPDASVAVKWLLQEPDSPAATALLHSPRTLRAPALLRLEARAAILRAFRMNSIIELHAREKLSECASILSQSRVLFTPDAALLADGAEIALRIKHSLQDCLYIACAARFGGELITTDATLLARAAPHYPFVRAL